MFVREREPLLQSCVCAGEQQKEREAELHSPTHMPVDRNVSFWARFVELQVCCWSCDVQTHRAIADLRSASASVEDADGEAGML